MLPPEIPYNPVQPIPLRFPGQNKGFVRYILSGQSELRVWEPVYQAIEPSRKSPCQSAPTMLH